MKYVQKKQQFFTDVSTAVYLHLMIYENFQFVIFNIKEKINKVNTFKVIENLKFKIILADLTTLFLSFLTVSYKSDKDLSTIVIEINTSSSKSTRSTSITIKYFSELCLSLSFLIKCIANILVSVVQNATSHNINNYYKRFEKSQPTKDVVVQRLYFSVIIPLCGVCTKDLIQCARTPIEEIVTIREKYNYTLNCTDYQLSLKTRRSVSIYCLYFFAAPRILIPTCFKFYFQPETTFKNENLSIITPTKVRPEQDSKLNIQYFFANGMCDVPTVDSSIKQIS
ncbi:hypothetical protein AGLY_011330 [Aphis glycines]|uniref:Uncharacterized protein n=1 Tax=Aphis glycines TaxID=307491 RepID=A0A6G0TDR0_APHGL|nr:hypothetical protein AGLY_011330 [Aphis glycines]